jgi:phytoene dehydrogenase-like protein
MKKFAIGQSEGPNLANLQLSFWRLAVHQFDCIKERWKQYAVENENEVQDYTEDGFVIDASVALVLAGTSVAELIGQNVPPDGTNTPHLRPAYKQLVNDPIPAEVEEFFPIYDSLRHFGPVKHHTIEAITEQTLCEYLATAQEVWKDVLRKLGAPIQHDFRHTFAFDDGYGSGD